MKTDDFSLLKTFFSSTHPTVDWKLPTRKGHFPYSYLDSFPKFEKPLLNYGDDWKNTLTGKNDISEADVAQAFKIYTLFGCRNLGDYHDVYLRTDVLILADVFEKFRQVCMKVYKLDPVHFFSAPNLSWDAMLNITRVDLGLLSDIDMLLIFERGIRGGINGIGELRHFRANNRDLDVFDESKAKIYGAFFDVTSVYAVTMQQTLPVDSYEWNETIMREILATSDDSVVGFFVEVEIAYPSSLHDSHNDLPLAPEKMLIRKSWLSPYTQSFNVKLPSDGREKLVETLLDKNRYVCHYRNLKFHVNHGLRVRKLQRVIQFRQSKWLGDYILKNTMRKQATNDFEKNFYKIMSKACFGKTMENLRNRREILFVNNEKQAEKSLLKPIFKSYQIIQNGLVSVSVALSKIVWSKPTPLAASILDLSKLSLYKFH